MSSGTAPSRSPKTKRTYNCRCLSHLSVFSKNTMKSLLTLCRTGVAIFFLQGAQARPSAWSTFMSRTPFWCPTLYMQWLTPFSTFKIFPLRPTWRICICFLIKKPRWLFRGLFLLPAENLCKNWEDIGPVQIGRKNAHVAGTASELVCKWFLLWSS